jgi:hypothetical protein
MSSLDIDCIPVSPQMESSFDNFDTPSFCKSIASVTPDSRSPYDDAMSADAVLLGPCNSEDKDLKHALPSPSRNSKSSQLKAISVCLANEMGFSKEVYQIVEPEKQLTSNGGCQPGSLGRIMYFCIFGLALVFAISIPTESPSMVNNLMATAQQSVATSSELMKQLMTSAHASFQPVPKAALGMSMKIMPKVKQTKPKKDHAGQPPIARTTTISDTPLAAKPSTAAQKMILNVSPPSPSGSQQAKSTIQKATPSVSTSGKRTVTMRSIRKSGPFKNALNAIPQACKHILWKLKNLLGRVATHPSLWKVRRMFRHKTEAVK